METKRLLSLDAFRGFTIAAMILVNFPVTGTTFSFSSGIQYGTGSHSQT